MDIEILLNTIMIDAKGSKSNIAARFQNAITHNVLPPIGVFWDIENCQVPKGKSAIVLAQNIREKFFTKHREAEFMCVCDINKESKYVIQELLYAQVTVVHISATSKNAADDKLKQCMKRYVDTHGSPSTLLLISDDVNFASDLSDFRHRHNIRIILIHRGHAHQSLLTCAHEQYDFSSITQDLPTRSPSKSVSSRPTEIEVTDLPLNRKEVQIRNKLRKLSTNCGGKVLFITGSKAVIRFANADAAEKAKKRMDKEVVFGNKISVNFVQKSDVDFSARKYSTEESAETSSTCSSRDSSPSEDQNSQDYVLNNGHISSSQRKFEFPPPPVMCEQNYPSFLKETIFSSHPKNSMANSKLMASADSASTKNWRTHVDWNGHSAYRYKDISAFSPVRKELDSTLTSKYPQRNVGKVSPFFMQDSKETKHNTPAVFNESSARRHFQLDAMNSSFSSFSASSGFSNLPQTSLSDPLKYSSHWSGGYSFDSRSCDVPVELIVSNLDQMFEINEMKNILFNVFSDHVMVLHISMSLQPDGSAKAIVKVPSLQDAQYAISRLHRKKIGHKRILISHTFSEKSPPFCVLKSETISLLNDIPSKSLPLIKFRELYEKRYHRPIAVSELYKMRDVVVIQGDSGSRVVYLNIDCCKTPSLPDSEDSQDLNNIERPYCERHFHVSVSEGWAEHYSICPLPNVHISLKVFSTAVHRLLDTHQGSLPLISFCDCYEAEIGPLPVVDERTYEDERLKGVPLEHLIACVNGVEVALSALCIKKVQWLENKLMEVKSLQSVSPALAGQLTLFGREVIDLLKNQPQCLVSFNKFIPTYHHHFGRQCRVADYGFTKLIDLLEAIPHIVQVLGEGQERQVTLTHRTQVKRFSAELLRILKSRASKQIALVEFPQSYEQVIEKKFEVTNYGVCEIEDLLEEVSENVIVICSSGDETLIGIPKREQTPEEIERTKQFAVEVIELLKHTPCCTMAFNKFIPAYHHHFGKQCRVADYGFTKLIELFEAIPHILEVTGMGEDKVLCLVPKEQHKILTQRLVSVLKSQPNEVIDIHQISSCYAQLHGHSLRPTDFGFNDLQDLVEHMDALKIVIGYVRTYVTLVDEKVIHQISLNIRRLLMEQLESKMTINEFCEKYEMRYGHKITPSLHFKDMEEFIEVKDGYVLLTPLQNLAKKIILLLQKEGGCVEYALFRSIYQKYYYTNINTKNYGFTNLNSLFEHFSDYFSVSGKKLKKAVSLNVERLGILSHPLPDFLASSQETELIKGENSTHFGTQFVEDSNDSSEESHLIIKRSPSCSNETSSMLNLHQLNLKSGNLQRTDLFRCSGDIRSSKSTPTQGSRKNRIAANFSMPA
ncbi:meiosis regulator and mRNA stability factor 1 isoform X1 [Parasteatoda tepidariorum]|uniref:meiosis regulator and mRNA stability factor 1 isoform X1 n=2 Tax=Parasteatoda tepidariorum TaxID=114398 RepID=UPI001C729441|nr:meiosis regulator and mRNA stability factor 1 isoform X1 [Parasteatoda tepidariorum]XP_015917257.2 meiosis regulator and mRNA stability factor 1 isoform X1 [Parasteatoda tepidariorum]XP_042910347.1 meiosis regulator and mRNA stability factor 1 isoform X1 [Parasteatoda tepidariorum]